MKFNPGTYINYPVVNFPNRPCVKFKGRVFTYGEINDRANRLASALRVLGLGKGSRIATLLYNSNVSVEVFLAAWKTGMIQVPLNSRNSARENMEIIRDYETHSILFGAEFGGQIEEFRKHLPGLKRFIGCGSPEKKYLDYESILSQASNAEPGIELDEEDLYKIHNTSGTTATPRGVMMTYRNRMDMISNFFMNTDILINEEAVFLHVAPLTHAAGYIFMPFYLKGAKHVVLEKFDTTLLLETIEKEKVTFLLLVPTMLVSLLENKDIPKYDLSSLKRIYYGAAPMPVAKLMEAIEVFGPIFQQNYGLTEGVQPNIVLNAKDHVLSEDAKPRKRLSSAGRRALGREIRIVDDHDRDVSLGTTGEILIRGGHVSPGYLNLPDLTREVYNGGWLHTGDLAYEDEDGYIYIVDRKKDMIISGGFNIYCREVEIFLDSHPEILESAVLGAPDLKWGEVVKAFVVLKDGKKPVKENEIIDYCAQRGLSRYKLPRIICFLDKLPKNENNKIMKRELKKRA
jgi:acyl-CoA synthetase (AMP-forming)/AMP-acid ligase II